MTDMAGLPLSIGHNYTYELYLKTVPALSVDTHTLSRHVEIMLRPEGGVNTLFPVFTYVIELQELKK